MCLRSDFKPFCMQEAELELEKQQQMVLLRELEEQKARLEQVLLEAQQEAAVTRDHPCVRGPARGHDACVSPHSDTGVSVFLLH